MSFYYRAKKKKTTTAKTQYAQLRKWMRSKKKMQSMVNLKRNRMNETIEKQISINLFFSLGRFQF